jgi:dihydroflavonol-4-reductase
MKGKILITGAAGFIGSHLVDLLLKEGEPIERLRLLILPNSSLENLPKKKFDIVWGDIRDRNIIKKAMKNVSVVYHLAARIDFDGKTYKEYKNVNVTPTQYLLEECKGKDIEKFIFFSSIGVFGMPADVGNIINWDETHKKTYTNFYGRSKYEGELAVIEAHKKWKIPYAIIRPASVYGPRDKGPTYELYRIMKKNKFVFIGNGRNLMHYVFVGDLVKGTRLTQLSKRNAGDYIIAGSEPTSFYNLAHFVAKSIDKTIPNIWMPKGLALFAGYIFEGIQKITGIKVPLFPSRVHTMTATYYYNISKAKKEIGYNPQVPFEEGARITGQWYLRHKWI